MTVAQLRELINEYFDPDGFYDYRIVIKSDYMEQVTPNSRVFTIDTEKKQIILQGEYIE